MLAVKNNVQKSTCSMIHMLPFVLKKGWGISHMQEVNHEKEKRENSELDP